MMERGDGWRFVTQTLVATEGACALVDTAQMRAFLVRHFMGDWGECDAEDCRSNDRVVKEGSGIIISVFTVDGQRLWVHSSLSDGGGITTLLLPEEY